VSSFDDKIIFPAPMMVLKDQFSLDMVLQIFLHQGDWISCLPLAPP
jgi:hypothetical protein